MDKLLRTLCLRGFREKGLYKALQKNKEIIAGAVSPANLSQCEQLFKELLDAHENDKLLPSVTSSNSSSSSSSDSDSSDESSGDGVKSDESEEEEVKMETADGVEGVKDKSEGDRDESMDTALDQRSKEDTMAQSPPPSEEEGKSSVVAPSADQRAEPTNQDTAAASQKSSIVPSSGVYDPTYPSMTLHFAVKVMEYIEAMQLRLITASLAVEVGVVNQDVLCTCTTYV